MRTTTLLAALALAAALAAVPAAAQPPVFNEAFQVRGAVGDIPTTDVTEPAGSWNLEQRYAVAGNGSEQRVVFAIPAGARLAGVTCDCDFSNTNTSNSVTVTLLAGGAATRTVRVATSQPFDSTVGFSLNLPPGASARDVAVIFYVPAGSDIDGAADLDTVGASTSGTSTIHYARFSDGDAAPTDLWFTIHPSDGTTGADPTPSASNDLAWLMLALGVVGGAALWAFLVQRGIVQKRGRRQVVATAAHVEAAANDPPAVLEGKKRALLAALKEVEVARQANEIPVEVYDAVKADLKKQTVTVMRALESAPSGADRPGA